jgi:hypothetical protein
MRPDPKEKPAVTDVKGALRPDSGALFDSEGYQ